MQYWPDRIQGLTYTVDIVHYYAVLTVHDKKLIPTERNHTLPSSLILTYLRTAMCLRQAFWMARAYPLYFLSLISSSKNNYRNIFHNTSRNDHLYSKKNQTVMCQYRGFLGNERKTYWFWGLDEDLSLSQLVLVLVHVDRVEEVQNPLPLLPCPPRPCLPGQDGVPVGPHKAILMDWQNVLKSYLHFLNKWNQSIGWNSFRSKPNAD
jgi:hypothetical protein